mmetsp:Transcript_40326/g.119544  ORF Transcript_40326/g.119544 Transcript_40326/m.119544 type:complete len:314 (+) Transcript_40326:255-1196(+)
MLQRDIIASSVIALSVFCCCLRCSFTCCDFFLSSSRLSSFNFSLTCFFLISSERRSQSLSSTTPCPAVMWWYSWKLIKAFFVASHHVPTWRKSESLTSGIRYARVLCSSAVCSRTIGSSMASAPVSSGCFTFAIESQPRAAQVSSGWASTGASSTGVGTTTSGTCPSTMQTWRWFLFGDIACGAGQPSTRGCMGTVFPSAADTACVMATSAASPSAAAYSTACWGAASKSSVPVLWPAAFRHRAMMAASMSRIRSSISMVSGAMPVSFSSFATMRVESLCGSKSNATLYLYLSCWMTIMTCETGANWMLSSAL